VYEINLDKLKENSHKSACIVGTCVWYKLRQVERKFAQECMDSTVYNVPVNFRQVERKFAQECMYGTMYEINSARLKEILH
jgi:hypothetical protein